MALFYLATFLYWTSVYVYQPVLAVHAENLGASMGLVGTIVGVYGLSQLLLRVPLGIWSDRVGVRKPFVVAGLFIAAVAALGLGLANDPRWLVAWRAMSGVAAAMWVPFTVLFASYFPPEKTTRALGSLAFLAAAGEMTSSYAGGAIAQTWGWRSPFFVGVALALLGAAVALRLPEKPLASGHAVEFRELLRIGTTPLLIAVSLVAMLSSWTQWVTLYGFSPVYAARLGADRAELGILTAVGQGAMMIGSLASSYFADWIGPRTAVVAGLGLQAAGALMVPFLDSLALMGLSQLMGGYGRGLSRPVLMADSIRAVPAADRATAMGVFQAVYALGMFMGPATTGLLGDAFGLASIFVVAGLASLLGIAMVAARVPARG